MSAISLNADPSAGFDAKLKPTQELLRQSVADCGRTSGDTVATVVQASRLGAEDMLLSHETAGAALLD